jgi:lysophospholipase L1-like esterase
MSGARKFLILLGILVLYFLWDGLSDFFLSYPITNFPPKGTVALALGDSLTLGIGASTPQGGYTEILSRRLGFPIQVRAVSGATSHDALTFAESAISETGPNVVIVFLGGNDMLQRVSPETTFQNIKAIIKTAQSHGAVVLLVGLEKFPNDQYAKGFPLLARETGAIYVENALGGIVGSPSLMSDEVHPNDRGYLKLADKIAPQLNAILLSAKP